METSTLVEFASFRVTRQIDGMPNKFHGFHTTTHESVIVKFGGLNLTSISEGSTIEELTGSIGFPSFHWLGEVNGWVALVTDTYGPSIEQIFDRSNRYLNLQSVAFIGEQLISRIECLHCRAITFGRLNPSMLAVGNAAWQRPQLIVTDLSTVKYVSDDIDSFRGDLMSIGRVLAYLCGTPDSWDAFESKPLLEQLSQSPNQLAKYMELASCDPYIDYNRLRNIFRDLYQELELQLELPDNVTPYISSFLPSGMVDSRVCNMSTDSICSDLRDHMSFAGRQAETTEEHLSDERSLVLLKALSNILVLYLELLIRDRPSRCLQVVKLAPQDLPNCLWRDLRGFLSLSETRSKDFRDAIFNTVYKFLTVLMSTVPGYQIYWTGYLLEMACSKENMLISETAGNDLRAWKQKHSYWSAEFYRHSKFLV